MKAFLKNIGVSFLSLAVLALFFGIGEAVCRGLNLAEKFDVDFKFYIRNVDNDLGADYNIEDAFLMWSLKPGYDKDGIKISSQGFRDKEYQKEKPKETCDNTDGFTPSADQIINLCLLFQQSDLILFLFHLVGIDQISGRIL